jgi:hypothetical protein
MQHEVVILHCDAINPLEYLVLEPPFVGFVSGLHVFGVSGAVLGPPRYGLGLNSRGVFLIVGLVFGLNAIPASRVSSLGF